MNTAITVLQTIVALGLLNVWLIRFKQTTAYRGGQSRSMPEEFAAYGLPGWSVYVVGALKISGAACLLLGIWVHPVVAPAALLIGTLMLGALSMHFRIGDPVKKSVPAFLMLTLCITIYWGSTTAI